MGCDDYSSKSNLTSFFWQGNLNLITQALAAVGCRLQVIPDPTTVHFHLPNGLSVLVDREYSKFTSELIGKFPHEREGILKFYGVCWKVCPDFGDCCFSSKLFALSDLTRLSLGYMLRFSMH